MKLSYQKQSWLIPFNAILSIPFLRCPTCRYMAETEMMISPAWFKDSGVVLFFSRVCDRKPVGQDGLVELCPVWEANDMRGIVVSSSIDSSGVGHCIFNKPVDVECRDIWQNKEGHGGLSQCANKAGVQ